MTNREERLVTPQTIANIDHWLDQADVFAKPYTQYVDGGLAVVGIRIGERPHEIVARFGDTVVRHANGTHTVLHAEDAAEIAVLRTRIAELESERHSTNEALTDAIEELRRRGWKKQTEDPHSSPLHHDYAVPHDLPPYEPNVRGHQ